MDKDLQKMYRNKKARKAKPVINKQKLISELEMTQYDADMKGKLSEIERINTRHVNKINELARVINQMSDKLINLAERQREFERKIEQELRDLNARY